MLHVLREVAAINDGEQRGVTRKEMAEIAKAAGMDPRGLAGYYTGLSKLLSKTSGQDARRVTKTWSRAGRGARSQGRLAERAAGRRSGRR